MLFVFVAVCWVCVVWFALNGCSLDVVCGGLLDCRLFWFISINGYFCGQLIAWIGLFYSFGVLVICLGLAGGLNSVVVLAFYFEL